MAASSRVDHCPRADELRDDAAAVDVADQHDRRPGGAREAHVGDVARAQIDLGGAAGALDQHQIGLFPEARATFEDGAPQSRRQVVIVARLGGADDAAVHHDLRADVALWL